MAIYTETSTVEGIGGGCAIVTHIHSIASEFNIRDIAYVKKSVQKGILEQVAIKEIVINPNGSLIYKDTFNALHGANDLVGEPEAVELATEFVEDSIDSLIANDPCDL
ncbi:MAG: hypothetical protein DRQ41_15225 [Gammaproteobacteria bacterium]|nr:MAG: hypothetical protein DRQ41_15225 [Gammaproteobacteria bacterium]